MNYTYEERVEYNDYILDIEVYYTFNKSDNPVYLGHAFFVLKDNNVIEKFSEDIGTYVQNVVNNIFLNKGNKLMEYKV